MPLLRARVRRLEPVPSGSTMAREPLVDARASHRSPRFALWTAGDAARSSIVAVRTGRSAAPRSGAVRPRARPRQSMRMPSSHNACSTSAMCSCSEDGCSSIGNDDSTVSWPAVADVIRASPLSVRPGPTSSSVLDAPLRKVRSPSAKRTVSRAWRAQYAGSVACASVSQPPVTLEMTGRRGGRSGHPPHLGGKQVQHGIHHRRMERVRGVQAAGRHTAVVKPPLDAFDSSPSCRKRP